MAARNFDNLQCLGKGLKTIAGSFAPNGSSAVAASSRQGMGWSVARTSTGLFTVTLNDKYAALAGMGLSLQLAAGDDKFVQWGAIDVVSAKTLQIRVWDASGAAVADIAADANNRIGFVLVLRNTSATPVRG